MGRGWRGGEPRVAALAGAAVAADGAPSGHRRRASPESSSARTHRSRPIAQARCKGESPQGAPLASRPRLCGSSAHTAAKAGYLQASQAEVAMTAERNWREQGLLQGLILLRHVGSFQIASLGVIARTCNAIRPIGTSPPRGSPRSVPARASQEMPKPRKTAGPWIAVSPWQSKQDKGTVSKEPPGDEAAGYSEVELPLVVGSCGGGGATPAAAASDMAVDPLEEAAAAAHTGGVPWQNKTGAAAAQAPTTASPAAGAAAAARGWATKKRKSGADVDDGSAAVSPLPSGTPPAAEGSMQDAEGGPGEPQGQAGGQAAVLEGTAYLALLPNGNITGAASLPVPGRRSAASTAPCRGYGQHADIAAAGACVRCLAAPAHPCQRARWLGLFPACLPTGHLVCPPSIFGPGGGGRHSYGLMGEVVVAGRECTRDAGKRRHAKPRVCCTQFAAWPAAGLFQADCRQARRCR